MQYLFIIAVLNAYHAFGIKGAVLTAIGYGIGCFIVEGIERLLKRA